MAKKTRKKLSKTLNVKSIIVLLVIVLAGVTLFASANYIRPKLVPLRIGDRTIYMEKADNPEERTKGLSGRHIMARDRAMLFVFDETARHCFWMKDMKFPLDMVWLNEEQRVIYIKENVQPESYPESFCPDKPAKYVIELNAGMSKELDLEAAH